MTKPAARDRQAAIYQKQKHQIWLVLGLVLLAISLDNWVFYSPDLEIAKSFCAGLFLAYLGQSLFTWFAYKKTGSRAGRQIMLNVYLGQVVKWIITLIGFALIFLKLQPMHAPSVFFGYIIVQVFHFLFFLKRI